MTDLERPRMCGSDEDRALLERAVAVPPVVPEELRLRMRRAIEERLFGRARRGLAARWTLAVAGTLLAGSALAYGLATQLRAPAALRSVAPPAQPVPRQRALRRESAPAAPAAPVAPRLRRRASLPSEQPVRSTPIGVPGLAGPDSRSWPLVDDADGADESEDGAPAASPPRLVITREGRGDVSLVLASDRVVGKVRDTPVALTIGPGQLVGKLGHRNIWLWLRGHHAEGDIGGIPVKFELVDIRDGHQLREGYSVRRVLPYGATRVEVTATSLSWFPGCEAALSAVRPGVYQGRCASGRQARVVLPPSWQRLPALTRLLLLSFFLTERDPAFSHLFGSPNQ